MTYCGRDAWQTQIEDAQARLRARMGLAAPARTVVFRPEYHAVTLDGASAMPYDNGTYAPAWMDWEPPYGGVRVMSGPAGETASALPFGALRVPKYPQNTAWGLTWKCRSTHVASVDWGLYVGQSDGTRFWSFRHHHWLVPTNWILLCGAGGTYDTLDTGVAVDTADHVFAIRGDGTTLFVYIDHQPCGELAIPANFAAYTAEAAIKIYASGQSKGMALQWMALVLPG